MHQYHEFRFALFPRWGGRALEIDNLAQLEWMRRFIGRLHSVGASQPFSHRPTLNIQNHGYDSYIFLIENNFIPLHIKENYSNAVKSALDLVQQRFEQVGDISSIRLHGDIHAGNVLWNDAGPHIVDLDDCMMGPAIQDIWMGSITSF